jgi:hypothetical protein
MAEPNESNTVRFDEDLIFNAGTVCSAPQRNP